MTKKIFDGAILTARFTLKPLTEIDVTERYARWLTDSSINKYITAKLPLKELRKYVLERINRKDVLFFGIFNKADGLHIGNIKYEPVNIKQGYAVMGILIGDIDWIGRGVAGEVIVATTKWLAVNMGIKKILLGVSKENVNAIKAYKKVGFVEDKFDFLAQTESDISMSLDIN